MKRFTDEITAGSMFDYSCACGCRTNMKNCLFLEIDEHNALEPVVVFIDTYHKRAWL